MPTQSMPNGGPSRGNMPPVQWGGSHSNNGNSNDQNAGNQQGWEPITDAQGIPIDPGDDDSRSNQNGWHQPGPANGNTRPRTTRFLNVEDALQGGGGFNGNGQWTQGNNVSR